MKFSKKLNYMCYCFVCIIITIDAQDLDKASRKRAFCGKRLTSILGQFCLEYPSHENDHPGRSKRQIISECCQNKCSLNYLLENYCQTVNTNALEAFKKEESREIFSRGPTTTESTLSRRYRQKNSLENVQISKNSQATVQNGDIVTAHRKRRNCSCKKGKKLMKLKQERRFWKILVKKNFTMLRPEIGEIEDQQTPFHVTIL